ncbi:MAG: FAD-binding protein [Gammaproteobacteria bacterium]|nr:FAD-binding protein [Gammaproteobacteria bacterium]
MAVLVIAEHDGEQLAAATRSAVAAAQLLGSEVDLLVAGHRVETLAAAAACIAGLRGVLSCDAPQLEHALAECHAPLVASLAGEYSHVFTAATTTGKNLLPRVAALLDRAQVSDLMAVVDAQTFVRPVYAGNALETVRVEETPVVASVRPTAFGAVGDDDPVAIRVVQLPDAPPAGSRFLKLEASPGERPELTTAGVVVSGGRGVGSAENFALIDQLADALGAAVGASRAAVDAGYVPNDYQVGQTGKVVAPSLYVAVGISGAIQHLAGMKDSKVIVAINKDPDAPIFQVADYGLVGDLFQIVPQLIAALEK